MNKAVTLFLCMMALPIAPQARDAAEKHAVLGIGALTCADFTKALKISPETVSQFGEWTMGYLSAFNLMVGETYDIAGNTTSEQIQSELDQYCKANPKEIFINALATLTVNLYDNRLVSAPDPVRDKNAPVKK